MGKVTRQFFLRQNSNHVFCLEPGSYMVQPMKDLKSWIHVACMAGGQKNFDQKASQLLLLQVCARKKERANAHRKDLKRGIHYPPVWRFGKASSGLR